MLRLEAGQERQLLVFALKFLAADGEQERRRLRWKETKEWSGQFVWELQDKLSKIDLL